MSADSDSGQANPNFPQLFSPIQVGPMTVRNRIAETTNSIGAGRADGLPDDAFIAHHVAKARGGTGWIGNETWGLDEPVPPEAGLDMTNSGAASPFASYQRPDFVERLATFCDAVHDAGAVAVFQMTHLNSTMSAS